MEATKNGSAQGEARGREEGLQLTETLYVGLFADAEGKEALRALAAESDLDVGGAAAADLLERPEEFKTRVYCDHATLAYYTQAGFGRALELCRRRRGALCRAVATHIGANPSATAVAVKVDLEGVPCCNETPHITLLTCRGGKPRQSNEITDWRPLAKPLALELRLDSVEMALKSEGLAPRKR